VFCTVSLNASGDTFSNNSITGLNPGYAPVSGGETDGGGIYAVGAVSISSSTISGNVAMAGETGSNGNSAGYGGNAGGGGIFSIGSTTVTSSAIINNSALGGPAGRMVISIWMVLLMEAITH
jgi:hypothetical protein